jgi:hypothetical protein
MMSCVIKAFAPSELLLGTIDWSAFLVTHQIVGSFFKHQREKGSTRTKQYGDKAQSAFWLFLARHWSCSAVVFSEEKLDCDVPSVKPMVG